MAKKSRKRRLYNTNDANMLQHSLVLKGYLTNNMADFTAFDSDFNAAFVLEYGTKLTDAENMMPDNVKKAQIKTETYDVIRKMEECRENYHDIMYFAAKAFPKLKGVLDEFGKSTYNKVSYNHELMFYFMKNLHEVATKYQAKLLAKNCPQAVIDMSLQLSLELEATVKEQNKRKGDRMGTTSKRIEKLNELWKMTCTVRNAGKLIYRKDWGKYQLFLIPWGKKRRSKGGNSEPENGEGE